MHFEIFRIAVIFSFKIKQSYITKGRYITRRHQSHLIQCHIVFLVMWRRESEVRERGRCFARQPPHKLNFRTMKQLDHNCISFSCHAIYNIPFLFTQIKELKSFYEIIYKIIYCISCLISRLKINVSCMRLSIRRYLTTCP